MMRPLVLTRHCTHRNCHGERNNESIVVMKTEDRRLSPDHHHHPRPTNRPQINTKLCWPRGLQTKPASPHITVRGCQEDFFRSETAANFYSVRAWPWRRADGGADCAGSRNGLILGGNAGRELTTVRWLVEFLTGYSENLLAWSDTIRENVGVTWITGTQQRYKKL